jgi:hypothetical protein
MLNNVLDQRRFGDNSNDTHMATAAWTRADVNRKDTAQLVEFVQGVGILFT